MMRSPDAVADVVKTVRTASFYRPAHELIYNAVLELYANGDPTDPISDSRRIVRMLITGA
ncbi:DnaB-like helicase N-terminal domain-containing protein [Kitasatospora sp. NPDC002551]|uniref:DnaB-like helicase N-terminal domain-containing protein n=1 Tax=Kitasatospora sp. NPDC002551 TaxID=3154539 RepID=UPI003327298A